MQFAEKGNNPLVAIGFLLKGFGLLGHPELRKFIILPMLINVVLYTIALTLGYFYITELIDQFIPDWLQWLSWVLWPLFFVSFFVAGFFSFTVVANIIFAPFYGRLSAKTLAIISNNSLLKVDPPWTQGLFAELKRLGYLASRALPLLVLSIIPGVNVLAGLLWVLFGAWAMALEYLAYPLENQGVLFSEQKDLLKSIRLGALSFGGLTVLGLAIPVLNIIVAPAAVIGATLYVNAIKKE